MTAIDDDGLREQVLHLIHTQQNCDIVNGNGTMNENDADKDEGVWVPQVE